MLANGVYLPPSSFESWFVSTAHDERAIQKIADALRRRPGRLRRPRRDERLPENKDITVVHVMRHGEVENPDGIPRPAASYHLSELGRQMAERVAEHLAGRDVTYVCASPLERAQETATPIAKAHGLDLDTDARLIEADSVFQGKQAASATARCSGPGTGSTSSTRSGRPGASRTWTRSSG